jgi:hypothetical protein
MEIADAITADLREVAELFDELAPLARDGRRGKEAMRIAARLAVTVKTTALAEQKVLYEALRTAGDKLAAYAREQPHESHALDVMIDKLLALRPGPDFEAVVAVAQRLFHHHSLRETTELLPAVCAELPAAETEQLATDFTLEKRRLRSRIERQIAPG